MESYSDALVECRSDHLRFRLDELPGTEGLSQTDLRDPGIVDPLGLKSPVDGGPLPPPRRFMRGNPRAGPTPPAFPGRGQGR